MNTSGYVRPVREVDEAPVMAFTVESVASPRVGGQTRIITSPPPALATNSFASRPASSSDSRCDSRIG